MAGVRDEIERIFKEGDALSRLIAILLGVYVLVLILQISSTFMKAPIAESVLPYLTLPSSLSQLLLKPWTLVSYMFIHEGFMHILFNLLYLYFAGHLFQVYLGGDKLLSTFLLGGIAGGVLYVISYNLFPFFSDTVAISTNRGASAGVMAVLIAVAVMAPNYPVRLFFVLEVKLWQVAGILLLLDLVYMPQNNAGGHIAHLGGALFGYFMAREYKNKRVYIGAFADRWLDMLRDSLRSRPKMKVAHSRDKKATTNRRKSNRQKADGHDQDKLDRILDKISKGGYDSLSKDEKDFLFRMSDK